MMLFYNESKSHFSVPLTSTPEVMCAVVSSSLRTLGRVSDQRGVRTKIRGFKASVDGTTERPTSSENASRGSQTFTAALHVTVLNCILLRRRLESRSVTDDVLASAREQLHLPVPRISVHCTGQREQPSAEL